MCTARPNVESVVWAVTSRMSTLHLFHNVICSHLDITSHCRVFCVLATADTDHILLVNQSFACAFGYKSISIVDKLTFLWLVL